MTELEARVFLGLVAAASDEPDHAASAYQVAHVLDVDPSRGRMAVVGSALGRLERRGLLQVAGKTAGGNWRWSLTEAGRECLAEIVEGRR